jgi:hypothetical protein
MLSSASRLMALAGLCAFLGGVVVLLAGRPGPPSSSASLVLDVRKLYRSELCKEISSIVVGVLDGAVREVDKAVLSIRDRGFCHSETRSCSDTISSDDWEAMTLQIASLEVLSSVYIGTEKEGVLVGAEEPTGIPGARARLMRTNFTDCTQFSSCYLNWISVDPDTGSRATDALRVPFDPRSRPWYALAKQQATSATKWTEPYVSVSNERDAVPLFGFTASRSVVSRRSGAMLGVVAVDLYFQYVTRWLERHEIGRSRDGVAMVMLPDSRLIAASSSSRFPIFKGTGSDAQMITASSSSDVLIKSTGMWMKIDNPDLFTSPGTAVHGQLGYFQVDKKNSTTLLFSAVGIVQPQTGLRLIVAVAVPLGDASPEERKGPGAANAIIAIAIACAISVAAAYFLSGKLFPNTPTETEAPTTL